MPARGQYKSAAWDDLSEFDRGWLVGVLEGEGSFTESTDTNAQGRKYRYAQVWICMTDRDSVERAASMMRRPVWEQSVSGKMAKPAYRVRLKGGAALELMKQVQPFMSRRRQERIAGLLERHARA